MKVVIMQPYFFPYLGYFSLIYHSDTFISFDTPQFIRKGWIERNRIAKLTGGAVYIKVPLVKAPLDAVINGMLINKSEKWQEKILSQLEIYKKKSPFYKQVVGLVEEVINRDFDFISELNEYALTKTSEYLGLNTEFKTFSKMDVDIKEPIEADEWALKICLAQGYNEYLNAPGGRSFFDTNKYKKNGVDLFFVEQNLEPYKGLCNEFEPGLSIIDVMMFNSPEDIREMLSKSSLVI